MISVYLLLDLLRKPSPWMLNSLFPLVVFTTCYFMTGLMSRCGSERRLPFLRFIMRHPKGDGGIAVEACVGAQTHAARENAPDSFS